MAEERELPVKKNGTVKKRVFLRKAVIAILVSAISLVLLGTGMLINNNVSFTDDQSLPKQVDAAIESAEKWVEKHRMDILEKKNVALLKMLGECDELKTNPVFEEIIRSFLATRSRPECWKRLIDPNWPVDELELNRTIEKENIDNKWVLYAIATDKAKATAEELHLFDPQRWQRRQLTHQLNALVTLKKRSGKADSSGRSAPPQPDENLDKLIEHLCERLSGELVFDMAVVDIYIQKVTFILRAGFPEKIRTRWVERIIASQRPDGGWNDRWFCFTSGRRPTPGFAAPPSDQHATIQALTALYLVKYRYPEQFGVKREHRQ